MYLMPTEWSLEHRVWTLTHLCVPVIWVETELPHSGQPYYLVEDMRILGQVPHPELQHHAAKPKPGKERNLLTLL